MPNMCERKVHGTHETNRPKTLNKTDKIIKVLNKDDGD